MPDAFSMVVPVAEPYRALAPDVASRYAELAGGSADAAAALASAVTAAIDRMAAGAAAGAEVSLAFTPDTGGIRVDVSCNGHRESVDVSIPVARR
ncbi:MAG TPA: hypothetical protein VN700_13535 [Vicinamibacterales bacterium]|nr:hypothetical protein [Vicinamibacterales bacterium]